MDETSRMGIAEISIPDLQASSGIGVVLCLGMGRFSNLEMGLDLLP